MSVFIIRETHVYHGFPQDHLVVDVDSPEEAVKFLKSLEQPVDNVDMHGYPLYLQTRIYGVVQADTQAVHAQQDGSVRIEYGEQVKESAVTVTHPVFGVASVRLPCGCTATELCTGHFLGFLGD